MAQQVKSFVNVLTPGDQTAITKQVTKMELGLNFFTRKPITITTVAGDFTITLNKVEAEDGSAESWNFEGFTEKHPVEGWLRTDALAGYIKNPT